VDESKDAAQSPLVSCIVPVFNGERYLREAIDSIRQQTYQPTEIIVVDDGSTDNTPAVIESVGDGVRSLRKDNGGPAAARNSGLRVATGELIAFLDADDRWHPEKLARQVARFAARPELDYCVTYAINFWIPELRDEETRFREHRIARPAPAYLTSALLARRPAFEAIGDFDETMRFGDSAQWFLRAAAGGLVSEVLPEVLYYRRLHHSNRSRRLNAASRDEFLQLIKRQLERRRRDSASS
jgi:glycosyltransferase involved in cell wall biosynthesis